MDREETVVLFLECEAKRAGAHAAALADGKSVDDAREIAHEAAKNRWNAWADDMLAKRKTLEESGVWSATNYCHGSLEPKNAETRAWTEDAETSFSRCLFLLKGDEGAKETPENDKEEVEAASLPVKSIAVEGRVADFRGFVFPGNASFDSATFSDDASFDRATFSGDARFHCATFSGKALFHSVAFSGGASFGSAIFSGNALLGNATFSGDASFGNAIFNGTAWFDSATFSGAVWFYRATFSGDARFSSATFSGDASFASATFSANAWFESGIFSSDAAFGSTAFAGFASFADTAFQGNASFASTTFSGYAYFHGAAFKNRTSFRDAEFEVVEKKADADFTAIKVERAFDLTGASFSRVPNFCQADFKQAPDLDGATFPLPDAEPLANGDPDLIPKYRALRRMAIQGADYEREQMAFKGELRSRRWTIDKWWHLGLWLGLCYDGFADCGRSFIRPFALWAFSSFGFALFYLRSAIDITPEAWRECLSNGGDPWAKALYISGRNALVLTSGRDPRVDVAYKCLFGETKGGQANIPDLVSFVEFIGQVPLSAVLIFLFLLAVKNRFKIK